jgi:hypothetical protein
MTTTGSYSSGAAVDIDGELPATIKEIEAAIDQLNRVITEMHNRLLPILAITEDGDPYPPDTSSKLSPFGKELAVIGYRISTATDRLQYLIRNCQL